MSKNLAKIKSNIRTTNPMFTDELLDLLCEYVIAIFNDKYSFSKEIYAIEKDINFQKLVKDLTLCNLK